jgi:hypothetical protein
MRLTNYIRDAFIKAAMADVPKAADHAEAIRKLATDDVLSGSPKEVQKLWANADTRNYINTTYIYVKGISVCVPSNGRYSSDALLSATAKVELAKMVEAMKAEEQKRSELESRLKSVAYACTTRKALAEALPEFEKYLPAEEEKAARSLPVIANLVADFTKAGWPKQQKQQTKVAA